LVPFLIASLRFTERNAQIVAQKPLFHVIRHEGDQFTVSSNGSVSSYRIGYETGILTNGMTWDEDTQQLATLNTADLVNVRSLSVNEGVTQLILQTTDTKNNVSCRRMFVKVEPEDQPEHVTSIPS
jgi:hypothetical protein